ncbi:tRNA (adenosine(37)-N6)-threonylcarbamoyltransferase complex ATPase subunit type 1 TsaE [Marinibacterium sp. SX1]|uniref:tRNA (adenosine(37)-N6)-threonylcarbamoyltransferase complex ATPase subunit type 1 TsaE n=1 Tax=Marinibacterium sp. SX1 TaxID=3388424 RepID=UPI003D17A452
MSPRRLSLPSPDATTALAAALGQCLSPGDVVLLHGPVGAGKSHFARGLIQSLQDIPEDVPSPTFTLVQSYDTTRGPLWHCDLYRMSGPDELIELGLIDAFDTAICLVEWPDRLGELAPAGALNLTFVPDPDDPDRRTLTIDAGTPDWAARLDGLAA